ncbi:hypothetical protein HCH_05623 [Hahella chejuensis KCTC 2396]|uniref:Uncharacterized protein n=1 Tax=Hahella chejuensis (strain KCTC 2396) TaxID=349521 RepID=Q2SAP3_HAHCH|nr:hypothetical protein HCH_05623 [Hahella chejuensis KCTC 2396]
MMSASLSDQAAHSAMREFQVVANSCGGLQAYAETA